MDFDSLDSHMSSSGGGMRGSSQIFTSTSYVSSNGQRVMKSKTVHRVRDSNGVVQERTKIQHPDGRIEENKRNYHFSNAVENGRRKERLPSSTYRHSNENGSYRGLDGPRSRNLYKSKY